MKTLRVLTVLLALAVAAPAFAGEKKPCAGDPADCAAKIKAKTAQMGYMGVELDAGADGLLHVTAVTPGSAAEAAGIEAGDVLLAIEGSKLSADDKAALAKVKKMGPGAEITLDVARAGSSKRVTMTLGRVPAEVVARWIGQHTAEHEKAAKHASAGTS